MNPFGKPPLKREARCSMFALSRGAVCRCRCSRCAVRGVRCSGLRIIDPMFKTIQICLKNGIEAARHQGHASLPSHTDHTVIRSYRGGLALRARRVPAGYRSLPASKPGRATCPASKPWWESEVGIPTLGGAGSAGWRRLRCQAGTWRCLAGWRGGFDARLQC